VFGGSPVTAAVVLNNNAPAGGTTVTLTSSNPSVVPVPSSVMIQEGSYQSVFALSTDPTSTNTAVTIKAGLDGTTVSSSITVTQVRAFLTVSPKSIIGGNTGHGTVTLPGPAYAGGIVVSLTSSDPSIAVVPNSVTVPAGATNVIFDITTSPVSSSTPVVITASSGVSMKSFTITVTAPHK
jgi:hypothetical protein